MPLRERRDIRKNGGASKKPLMPCVFLEGRRIHRFPQRRKNQRYCSRRCANADRQRRFRARRKPGLGPFEMAWCAFHIVYERHVRGTKPEVLLAKYVRRKEDRPGVRRVMRAMVNSFAKRGRPFFRGNRLSWGGFHGHLKASQLMTTRAK